jgi:60 kDa SS-A/Ro ribonucleoprotein
MSQKYHEHFSTKKTPQSEPIPGRESDMSENSAGGFSFGVDDWTRLDRFLVLGAEGGSYYADEQELSKENAQAIVRLLPQDGVRVVEQIVKISEGGRAPKNDPAIFALALCMGMGDNLTKKAAAEALPKVCRIGTHLFSFVDAVQAFRGWGRGLKKAVAAWYNDRDADKLAFQMTKYRQRDGWSHHDVLHKCHAKPASEQHQELFRWAKDPEATTSSELVEGWRAAQDKSLDVKALVKLIEKHRLTFEMIPTDHQGKPAVWEALLPQMGLTALIRNLGRMTANGLIAPMSQASSAVVEKLADEEALKRQRVHPLNVLNALMMYQRGRGLRGSLTWAPERQVVDALDDAFYKAFGAVESAGKRWLLALDVSGSMCCEIHNMALSCRDASGAMALVTAATEPNYHTVAFTGGGWYGRSKQEADNLTPLAISPQQRLDDVIKTIDGLDFGGTDCALPMLYALKKRLEVDAFVVYTDSETWAGDIHPTQALQKYRNEMGIPAKLIVVGMVANGFTIADPADAGMLDVVGFDTAVPNVMADFVK